MDIAILTEIIKESKRNWRFIFESPMYEKLDYIPGQLVQLYGKPWVEPSDNGPRAQRLSDSAIVRNYSVSSWPDGSNKFELIITNLEGGKMSDYLFKEAKIGDEFVYKGPIGVFTLPGVLDRDIFLVSTGSGISPFRSMINHLYTKKINFKSIKLFFGTRTEEDLLYREELESIAAQLPEFEYIPCLSREDKPGFAKGYVHEHYLKLIDEMDEKPLVYYCGWGGMVSQGRFELAKRGFEMNKDIRVEIFG